MRLSMWPAAPAAEAAVACTSARSAAMSNSLEAGHESQSRSLDLHCGRGQCSSRWAQQRTRHAEPSARSQSFSRSLSPVRPRSAAVCSSACCALPGRLSSLLLPAGLPSELPLAFRRTNESAIAPHGVKPSPLIHPACATVRNRSTAAGDARGEAARELSKHKAPTSVSGHQALWVHRRHFALH